MHNAGYNNYWKVLDASDFEIPQGRERVFIVSIRKDIDSGIFRFPEPVELKRCLGHLLEGEVPDKFYLTEEKVEKIVFSSFSQQRENTIQSWGGYVRHC